MGVKTRPRWVCLGNCVADQPRVNANGPLGVPVRLSYSLASFVSIGSPIWGRILCPEPIPPLAIAAIRFPDPSDTPPGAPETNARTSSGLARNRCSVHPEALVHLRQLRPVELLDRLVLTRIRTKVDTALIPAILIAP